jgi:hypothetical protein
VSTLIVSPVIGQHVPDVLIHLAQPDVAVVLRVTRQKLFGQGRCHLDLFDTELVAHSGSPHP